MRRRQLDSPAVAALTGSAPLVSRQTTSAGIQDGAARQADEPIVVLHIDQWAEFRINAAQVTANGRRPQSVQVADQVAAEGEADTGR
ncbi:MAG: hypothetical protein H6651_19285 [Ardenticatenales bacterium]|nr:hypothetical protein [Ardenticatenales bacterium]